MDTSIVSREEMRQRGARAFDEGRGVEGHNMNPGAPAIKDWQYGWHTRRIERAKETSAQEVLAS